MKRLKTLFCKEKLLVADKDCEILSYVIVRLSIIFSDISCGLEQDDDVLSFTDPI